MSLKKNEIQRNKNFKMINQTKMLLPNNCYTSFHDVYLNENEKLLQDCSRSFDLSLFNRRDNLFNLNLINNSLLLTDSIDLQWCLEPGYQNSKYEQELCNELFHNSSSDNSNKIENLKPFNFYSNQNYQLLSRNLDVNLAQLDIETFNRMDMNDLLSDINSKFTSSEEMQKKNLIESTSISEIDESCNEPKHLNYLKPVLDSSFSIGKYDDTLKSNENNSENKSELSTNLESVGISIDSLDMSYFDQTCNDVVNKCKKQDKSKYTIAFEQMEDSSTDSILDYISSSQDNDLKQKYDQFLIKFQQSEEHLNKMFLELKKLKRDHSKLIKSEYLIKNDIKSSQSKINESKRILTKSLQRDLMKSSFNNKNENYVPLFDLNNSFHSNSSLTSKNLLKLLTQNKNYSSVSQSVESQINSSLSTPETSISDKKNLQMKHEEDKLSHLGNLYNTFRNVTEVTNNKILYNRQASPIREEDECLNDCSSIKDIKKYTSFQNFSSIAKNNLKNCPRSISMNDFDNYNNELPNLLKQYSIKNSQKNNRLIGKANKNSKDCSFSSGYFSGGSNNLNEYKRQSNLSNKVLEKQNTVCFDKEVQTSFNEENEQPTPILLHEYAQNCCNSINKKSPIYVYYPNYSLPDLNFVNKSLNTFQNVHLSPTKLNNIETSSPKISVNLRSKNTNARPKSCGDFDKLTKDSFKHIKDWESLNTLLPEEIKEFIKNLKPSNLNTKSKTTSNTPTSNKFFVSNNYTKRLSEENIKLRSRDIQDGDCLQQKQNYQPSKSNNQQSNLRTSKNLTKRFSLQEPIDKKDCLMNISTETYNCSSINKNLYKRGMIKSATMNMPILQRQHQDKLRYQNNSNYNLNCHYSNDSCYSCSSCHHSDHYCCKFNCSKPYVINEQLEEENFDELNDLNKFTNNGEIDFDKLLGCTDKKEPKKLNEIAKELRDSKENFKDLKNHWEKMSKVATKPILKKSTPTTPTSTKSFTIRTKDKNEQNKVSKTKNQNIQTKIQNNQKSQNVQTKIKSVDTNNHLKKNPVKLRSQVKAKVDCFRSRSKSPEKSNKEIIILNKNRPDLPQKPIKQLKQDTKKASTSNSSTQTFKKPVRPNSFNYQFKSMIPIAKNSIRSPTTK